MSSTDWSKKGRPPASELLQDAVRAEVRRRELLERGVNYDAAGAHIAYWFAWLVEHDLESGFVCTDSDDLIREYVASLNRLKDRQPGAIDAMLGQAEELHGTMLSDAGNRFTKANYEQYIQDYATLMGQEYAEFSGPKPRHRSAMAWGAGPRSNCRGDRPNAPARPARRRSRRCS